MGLGAMGTSLHIAKTMVKLHLISIYIGEISEVLEREKDVVKSESWMFQS